MDIRELISHAPKQAVPHFDIRTYPRGSGILVPDAKNSSLYLLLERAVEVYQHILNGMFTPLYRYSKSSCSSEVEPHHESRTTLGVSAIDTCRIVKLSRENIETWTCEDNGSCEFLLRQMALKIAGNSDAYIRSFSTELKDRVLYCLYRHDRIGILGNLIKERLMNEVCTPIRNLDKVLAQCREKGLVAHDKYRFCIVDEEGFLDAADKLVED